MKKILLAIIAAAVTTMAGAQEDARLPDIGSSAGTLLSPDQERQIGENMLRQLRGQSVILEDALIDDYFEAVGYRLVAQSERPDQEFTFFVVRSPDINAFAAPGGYVGMYTGLIETAESESEIAAVLAHETAHVTQHHLVRAYEGIRNASIPIALAMLGALIASRNSSGDAAQAAIVGGSALMQQTAINFTRSNEYEADRIGIHTLARAGYDPLAMADFFGRMGRALRANGDSVPEFLRTHPVTTTRISEAKNRADQIKHEHVAPATATPLDANAFLMFRERARALASNEPASLVDYYRRTLAANEHAAPAYRYGLALSLTRAGRAEEALPILRTLLKEQPDEVGFALALADAQRLSGKSDVALAQLAQIAKERPGNRAVAIAYADQLTDTGKRAQARIAVEMLRPLVAAASDNPLLQLSFARSCELSGDLVRAGEAHAEVALLNGRFEDALNQLSALLKRPEVDYYQRARIEARIAQVTPYALEEKRKPVPPEPS